ncbi:hypothetical protein OTB20_34230 [Streptomyces sp. H27-H1]|uniref:hypothetical protein n=1 Tax=unclassified Streptomyces TaxID=2593676 RepID=UPI00226E8BB6|nr:MULTISPECIES: hypothetical protein [unclassified Streptomyces]MCY0931154.1 hypothetical protein [Streptomyces sp. H27-H1]MCY0939251.1 hypothetical protein [Streptomyces sp. H34-S4]
MSFKHLPIIAAGEIIATLNLNGDQTARAADLAAKVVRRAWSRRPGHKRDLGYPEFAASVPACSWLTMFKVAALLELGRAHEASQLMTAARIVHGSSR